MRAAWRAHVAIAATSRHHGAPMQHERIKGRGSAVNPEGRYIQRRHEAEDDGWFVDGEPAAPPRTTVTEERARSIVSRNASPDLAFTQSINPYRGCEHGLTMW